MRIGQYGNIPMNSSSSGTKKIGGVSLPDFNDFHCPTKTSPAMSDDKFKEAIISQAKKDQAAGRYQNNAESRRLQKQYVSVVSPDRKGFITEALTQISKKPPSKIPNLIELMFGKVKYQNTTDGLSYAEFVDSNGDHVATFSNGEWTFYGTKEEFARESEFNSIYREAWGSASKAANGQNINMSNPESSASESSFDKLA